MKRTGSRLPEQHEQRTQIDSSLAMVNIVLLLIFFFIASGTLMASQEARVELPLTVKLPLDALPQPMLEIGEDGSMLLDGSPITSGGLAAATIDEPLLHVLADRESNAIAILETLEAENLVAVEVRLVTIHRGSGEDS